MGENNDDYNQPVVCCTFQMFLVGRTEASAAQQQPPHHWKRRRRVSAAFVRYVLVRVFIHLSFLVKGLEFLVQFDCFLSDALRSTKMFSFSTAVALLNVLNVGRRRDSPLFVRIVINSTVGNISLSIAVDGTVVLGNLHCNVSVFR